MFDRRESKTVLTTAIAVLFVMAFALSAFAYSAEDTPFTYSGKIMAIDNANRIVTIQAGPNDQLAFNLNGSGVIMQCNKPIAWSSLKKGDSVTVSYFEKSDGNFVADTITLAPGMMGQHC